MKLCCSLFEEYINEAGEAGASIIAGTIGVGHKFFIQTRACRYEELEALEHYISEVRKHAIDASPLKIRIHTLQGISYCPFCGKKLASIINKQKNGFIRLAESHQKFMSK